MLEITEIHYWYKIILGMMENICPLPTTVQPVPFLQIFYERHGRNPLNFKCDIYIKHLFCAIRKTKIIRAKCNGAKELKSFFLNSMLKIFMNFLVLSINIVMSQ
jgi:hypothetical protein